MAMVAIFLVTLAAGAFDFGMAWRTGLATNEGARSGARVGSAIGPDQYADYYALSSAKSALDASGELANVQRVIIYRSSTANGAVPPSCLATSPSGPCTVLTGAQFRTNFTQANFNAQGCFSTALQKGWCPTSRDNVQLSGEYFGMAIKIRHDYQFPLLGPGTDVNRRAVMRLEPKE